MSFPTQLEIQNNLTQDLSDANLLSEKGRLQLKTKKLDLDHPYGDAHPLVGKACLYRDRFAIPYGAYRLEAESKDKIRLAIVFNDDTVVRAMAGVKESELFPIDSTSIQSQRIFHSLLSNLARQIRHQRIAS